MVKNCANVSVVNTMASSGEVEFWRALGASICNKPEQTTFYFLKITPIEKVKSDPKQNVKRCHVTLGAREQRPVLRPEIWLTPCRRPANALPTPCSAC
jgi:hypothetical protein